MNLPLRGVEMQGVTPTSFASPEAGSAASKSPVLSLRQISRRYGDFIALDALSIDILPGEFVSVLGPSGSGKTTTLNLIAGFDQPSAGSIMLAGRDVTEVPAYDRGMGMVFQNYALFPHMTVFENVAFPLRSQRWPNAKIKKSVQDALDLVQLSDSGQKFPRQLSGGQQQRVAFARAIVYQPPILLMDEPLGALDRRLRSDMQVEIKRLHRQIGVTILYVTHDQDEALSMSDRIAVLHQGRLMQIGSPRDVYWKPQNRFTAGFVGEINFLPGRVSADGSQIELPDLELTIAAPQGKLQPHAQVTLAVRPESLVLAKSSAGGNASAVVEDVLFLGDSMKILLRLRGNLLNAKVPSSRGLDPQVGDRFSLTIDSNALSVFGSEDV